MILEFSLILISLFLIFQASSISNNGNKKKKVEKDSSQGRRKYFPGPIPLPYIGSLLQFGYLKYRTLNKQHVDRAHELCNIYGKTCQGWAGAFSLLLTEDVEVAKHILNSPDFTRRLPSHPRWLELAFCQNLGLLFGFGEPHKEIRRFVVKALRKFGLGELKTTEAYLDEELEHFKSYLSADAKKNPNHEVYFAQYMRVPIFNSLWKIMAGTRFGYSDPVIHKIIEAVEKTVNVQVGFDIEWPFPCLRYVPGFSNCWQQCKNSLICHAFFKEIMIERRKAGNYKENQTNFIDHFLLTVDQEKFNSNTIFTDEQFIVTCCDLLYTGIDTTSNSVEFTILYLAKYPHVQKKLQAEIDSVIGRERLPDYDEIKLMPYTRALYLEILRNVNINPLSARASNCDTEINGYFVQADVLVGINQKYIHNNPDTWGDPEVFRPERFLDQNMNIINEDKLIAFGGGKRLCIGMTMAKITWFKFITSLFQSYNFIRSPHHPTLDPTPIEGVANSSQPFYCIVKEREV